MCGRYALYDIQALDQAYDRPEGLDFRPNYNVAPTQVMPVVTETGLHMMRWGLIPRWSRDDRIGYRLINARAETVFAKPIWKAVITRQKCLIPANGFYEWQARDGGKQPYFIRLKQPGMFMMAGVWESWRHEGRDWQTYSILTTTPNREMKALHDRMPLILHQGDYAQWLAADRPEDIQPLLLPYEDNQLETYQVGREVNAVRTNTAELILPLKG